MKKLLQFKTKDGNDFFIEIDDLSLNEPTRGGSSESGNRGIIQNAADSFDKALEPLKEVSNSIINCIKEFSSSPKEVEVELGLKFTAKAGIILTSLDSEAHLKIVLKWQNSKDGN
jgi:hypothetical protein